MPTGAFEFDSNRWTPDDAPIPSETDANPDPLSRLSPHGNVAPRTLTFVMPGLAAGGSEHVVTMLCNHYAGKGCRVRLVCFEPLATRPYYALHPEVELVRLDIASVPRGAVGGSLAVLRRYRLLRAEFRRHRPAVVVAFLTRTNVLAALAASALDIPVIVSERNNPDRQHIGAVWNVLRERAYARSDALVTMTGGARSWFAPASGRLDVVIPNHAFPAKRPRAFDPAGRELVAVGRLVDQKGFDLLLRAFAAIAPRFPDWRLTIWGEGPLREDLERQCAALGLDGQVRFPGVTREPREWTAGADLFVLSSRYEGWGIVVGEAMAAGIPTVAFDCPWGPAEMIEHGRTGLLAPDQDVAALARQLAAAMEDPALRESLGAAGRLSMKRFEPETILRSWDELIGTVARRQARPRAAAIPGIALLFLFLLSELTH